MNPLQNFLEKFKNILSAPLAAKQSVILSIKEAVHVDIKSEDVTIKDGVIYIMATPLVRNEIYMRKRLIIKKINEALSKEVVKDIR